MTKNSKFAVEWETSDLEEKQNQSAFRRGFGNLGKLLVGILVVGSFGVWVYAYSGAAVRDAPDRFEDIELSRSSEAICQGALVKTDELPNALDAKNEVERAKQLNQTTAILAAMVNDIDQLTPSNERDATIMGLWVDDWRVLLTDRTTYADRLAADPDAKFYVTNTGVGERLDKRITRLANTNSMPSCAAPTDVG